MLNKSDSAAFESSSSPVARRDFLYIATGAIAAVGVLQAGWPLIAQMEPASNVLAAGGPVSIDLARIQPGQQVLVMWQRKPIFVVHRTPPILNELKSPALLGALRDPNSQELQQPKYVTNWCRSIKPEYLVIVGVCTHLGCIPTFTSPGGSLGSSWPGGYLCHCHGSKYDLAGRVFKGVPAPYNLPVPPHHFASPMSVVVGENPEGETYALNSIEQL